VTDSASWWRTSTGLLVGGLLAAAGCTSDAAGPPPVDEELVQVSAYGRVHTLTGGMPPGLRASIVAGRHTASEPVSADGTFNVTGKVPVGTWDVVIDVPGTAQPTLPALIRYSSGMPQASDVTVLLVPRQWSITSGSYAGSPPVDISLDAAFRPPCTTDGDTNCDGFYPTVWSHRIILWPETALPIRVAFDRTRTTQPISASDSVVFWQTLQRMNDDFGASLFRPVREQEIAVNAGGVPNGGILVRVDTTITGFGAWTNWWWNAAGQLYAGVVRPRTASMIGNPSLMSHEMLHTHGFKHSCSWSTVMGGYGCGSSTRLSVHDVAYAQLAVRIAARQRETGAAYALTAARDGERVLLHGLPPLGLNARVAAMRSDSIGERMGDHAH
jgi:hypothetical protein